MITFETPHIKNKRIGSAVILGAGPTGLSMAWRLASHGWRVTVIEKDKALGGHGGTRTINGYDVDDGPHKLYPQVPCAKPLIDHFVGEELLKISKKSLIYLGGKYIPFPFGIVDLFRGLGLITGMRCGLSYVWGKFVWALRREKIRTYSDFVVAQYGRYAHGLVFVEVARKLWGDPDKLDVQLARTRIIAPSITDLIKGLLFGMRGKPKLSADSFYYPRRGLRTLWENMAKEIEKYGGLILRLTRPTKIIRRPKGFSVRFMDGEGKEKEITCDVILSTIPIKSTYEIFEPRPPEDVMEAVSNLKYSSLLILYVVVDVPRLLPANWIFFPEGRYHFGRISEQKGFSEEMIPRDRTVLLVEIPLARPEVAGLDRDELIQEALLQLRESGVLKPEHSVLETFTPPLTAEHSRAGFTSHGESVYPIYDLDFKKNLDTALRYSDSIPDFYLNGRNGLFCYNNMDHSMEMGLALADHVAGQRPMEEWQKTREGFYEYKIVD